MTELTKEPPTLLKNELFFGYFSIICLKFQRNSFIEHLVFWLFIKPGILKRGTKCPENVGNIQYDFWETLENSGECFHFNNRGNARKDSQDSSRRFRGMFQKDFRKCYERFWTTILFWAIFAGITYLSYIHSHNKRKGSLETRAVLLIFLLKLEIFGVAYTEYVKTAKKAAFREDFINGDDFDAVLA